MDVSEWAKLLRQLFTITFNLSVMYKYKLRRGSEIEIEKFRNTDFHHQNTYNSDSQYMQNVHKSFKREDIFQVKTYDLSVGFYFKEVIFFTMITYQM